MYEFCYYLVINIHKRNIYPEKENIRYHVLIFLPGFNEIAVMHDMINSRLGEMEKNQMEVHRLHSNLSE